MGQKSGKWWHPVVIVEFRVCWQRFGQGSVQAPLSELSDRGSVLALPGWFSSHQKASSTSLFLFYFLPSSKWFTISFVKPEVNSCSTYICVLFHFLAAVVLSAL